MIVNTSKSSCRLIGYPKVVTDPASYKGSNVKIVHGGGQIFMAVAPRRVSIRPGATASFGLDYGDAYDQGDPAAGPCMTKSATVYLPTRSRPYSQPFNVTLSVNFCFAGFGFAVTSIQPGPIPRMH